MLNIEPAIIYGHNHISTIAFSVRRQAAQICCLLVFFSASARVLKSLNALYLEEQQEIWYILKSFFKKFIFY